MCSIMEISVNPMVAILYKECKEECKFSAKSDSDFLLFLLNSAVRILSVVKDFSPVLELSQINLMPSQHDDGEEKTPIKSASLAAADHERRMEDYEDMLLDEIEKSSDVETLQKYIDTVQNSLHTKSEAVNDDRTGMGSPHQPNQPNQPNKTSDGSSGGVAIDSGQPNNEPNKPDHESASVSNEYSTSLPHEQPHSANESQDEKSFECGLQELAMLNAMSASAVAQLKCSLCNVQFKNQRNLSRHIRLGICLQGTFNCTICDHSFASERGLKRHLHRTMCKKRALEENLIPNQSKLIKLEKLVENAETFLCEKCNYTFSTRAALAQHTSSSRCDSNRLQGMSIGEPKHQESFMCQHCKSTLASKAGLAKHLKRGQCRLYQCSDCTKAFRYLHELRAHMRQEHMTDEINTSSLAQTFLRMGGVPSMTHSTNILNTLTNLSFPGLSIPAQHKCKVCNYAGTCKRSLENHMRMHVRQLKAIGDNVLCTQCAFTSPCPDTMLRHYITDHPGLPYFKMAPKGTHIIRSNRLTAPGNMMSADTTVYDTSAIMKIIDKINLEHLGSSDMEDLIARISSANMEREETGDRQETDRQETDRQAREELDRQVEEMDNLLRSEPDSPAKLSGSEREAGSSPTEGRAGNSPADEASDSSLVNVVETSDSSLVNVVETSNSSLLNVDTSPDDIVRLNSNSELSSHLLLPEFSLGPCS